MLAESPRTTRQLRDALAGRFPEHMRVRSPHRQRHDVEAEALRFVEFVAPTGTHDIRFRVPD